MTIDRRAAYLAVMAILAFRAGGAFCAEPLIVTGIRSSALAPNAVRVSWEPPSRAASSFRVYRSESPIRDLSALAVDSFLGELPSGVAEFVDRNAPPSSFYAVIALFEGMPFDIVIPSLNATVSVPRSVPETGAENTASSGRDAGQELRPERRQELRTFGNRPVPLPALAPPGIGIPQGVPVPAEETGRRLSPYIFDHERIASRSGESFLLYDIVSGPFAAGRYEEALSRLDEFLRVNRGQAAAMRAEFYRGECRYFLGDYKTALKCFLTTKTVFPDLSSRWIDAALRETALPGKSR
jgi:hypothetical protein